MRSLQELKGQNLAKRMLERYLEIPAPPLLIFHGPAGTGKWSTAEAFIKQKFCEIGTGCGRCPSCRKMEREDHPDYIRFPEEKILIGDEDDPDEFTVRWLIRKRLRYTPFESKIRFVLFPGADLIQNEAETALLKTLEEPPEHTRFILLTERLEDLKPTILSRGVPVPFGNLSSSVLGELTQGRYTDRLDLLGGSLELVPFLETELFQEMENRVQDLMDHPLKLLDVEKWLYSGEKTAFASQTGEENFTYADILDWFGLVLLYKSGNSEKHREIGNCVFELKDGLRREMAGMQPYLLSRFFHDLERILFA